MSKASKTINPYIQYYVHQAKSGTAGFQGVKYQRGHGFFGSIFRQVLRPLAKYLGTKALSTGVEIGSDYLKGESFKESAKKRLKSTEKDIISDAVEKAKQFAQNGSGKKRKCKSVKKTNNKHTKKLNIKKKIIKRKKKRKTKKSSPKKCKSKKNKPKKSSVKKKKSTSKQLKSLFL
jgi:hypothetical protein